MAKLIYVCSIAMSFEQGISFDSKCLLFAGRLPALLAAMKKNRRTALEASKIIAWLLGSGPEADSELGAQLWQMGAVDCLSQLLVTTEGPDTLMQYLQTSQGEA